jgi:hypothetical protein
MTAPKVTHSALYRASQFFAALKATLPPWAGGATGGFSAADRVMIETVLSTPIQQRLFAGMPPNDQRHAVAVAGTLRQAGYRHLALMQAALLHDVAKSLSQPIIHRVIIVLLEAFWPAALQWLSNPDQTANEYINDWANLHLAAGPNQLPDKLAQHQTATSIRTKKTFHPSSFRLHPSASLPRWRRPFVIHAHHPTIGAHWAEQAACDPLAVKLIARHQDDLAAEPDGEEDKLLAALQWADSLN